MRRKQYYPNLIIRPIKYQWVSTIAHVCRDKTKGPPLYFCPILFIEARGRVGTCVARGGVFEGPSQCFYARFQRSTSDPAKGRGTQAHINPLPSGCNHHRYAHYALSSMCNIKSPTQQFFTRVSGERQAIRRGGGGKMAHITPSPPGCDHHQNAHHARSSKQNMYISIRSPVLAASPQPRQPPHAPAAPPPRFFAA